MTKNESGITFKGREFDSDELDMIRELVGNLKRLSRQELAHTVCELLGWRRANGKLKTMEARGLLELMEASGQIALPDASRRGRPKGSKTKITLNEVSQKQREFSAQLREVEPVKLRLVETAEQRRQWRELVERYHPEGCRVPVGAHLQYLVEICCPLPEIVGCLQLSSPAWKMKVRDRFIGWNQEGHRANLQKVVNNSRFLMVPWVHYAPLGQPCVGPDGPPVSGRLGTNVWDQAVAAGDRGISRTSWNLLSSGQLEEGGAYYRARADGSRTSQSATHKTTGIRVSS